MDKNIERKINIKVIKAILGMQSDNTYECSGKLPLTLTLNNGEKQNFDIDRMVLECDEDGICTVWFDELSETGIANTFSLSDFTDDEVKEVFKAFDKDIVDAVRKFIVFNKDNGIDPLFVNCNVKFKGDTAECEYLIKLSSDLSNDEEDDKIGYYCNSLSDLISLFNEENPQEFVVLGINEYYKEI